MATVKLTRSYVFSFIHSHVRTRSDWKIEGKPTSGPGPARDKELVKTQDHLLFQSRSVQPVDERNTCKKSESDAPLVNVFW